LSRTRIVLTAINFIQDHIMLQETIILIAVKKIYGKIPPPFNIQPEIIVDLRKHFSELIGVTKINHTLKIILIERMLPVKRLV
jgi:hypothetical protein